VDEKTGKRTLDPERISRSIRILACQPVGRYALALRFSDQHGSGIYTFDRLRRLAEQEKEWRESIGKRLVSEKSASADTSALDPETLRREIEKVLETEINPGIASHGGKVELVELQDTTALVRMSGGCQGCAAS